jgi:uncharacterized protein (DUF362 family)
MTIVSIVKVEDERVEGAVRRAIELAGGLPPEIAPASTVLIKPNVVNASPSGSGRITDVRVTEAVTRIVLEHNPGKVIIGEGSSVGYDFPGRLDSLHCLEASGTAAVAYKLGVELVDLNRDEHVQVRAENAYVMGTFGVAKSAWQADVIVDLPVVKTHVRTGITCALKNMKGVLPGDEKKRTHRMGLDRAIVDLNRVMRPHFTVVDAIVGVQGTHSQPEDRVPLGRIVAGADVVAVDTVCATMMGFDVAQVHHIQLAAEAGLGVADLDQIEVRGERIAASSRRFVPYQEAARERFGAATIIERDACTGCMGEMVSLFIYLKQAGFEGRLEDLALIMGTPENVPPLRTTPVVIGKCARDHRHLGVYVPGCPPHGMAITDAACQALGIDQETVHKAIEALHDF